MVVTAGTVHSPVLTISLYTKPNTITGKELRDRCLAEYTRSCKKEIANVASFSYAQLDYPQYTYQGMLTFVACDELEQYLFDIRDDLMKREHLIVFTEKDTLKRIAVDRHVVSAEMTPGATTRKQQRNSTAIMEPGSVRHSISSIHLHSARSSKRLRPELTFDNVPAMVGSVDLKDINTLIENGTIQVSSEIEPFLCRECLTFPSAVLTMSCCGSVICAQCAPTPPTVQMATSKDKMCPVCGEEPLEPPLSHPEVDKEGLKLVQELKVLYLPHVRLARRRQERSSLEYSSSIPTTPYLTRNSPVL